MKFPDHITAIIFDCDGVLVDSEVLGLEDSVAFLRSQGFQWTAKDVIQRFTGYRDDVFRGILEDAYFKIHGKMPTDALFEGLVNARRRLKDKLQAVPDVHDAVRACEVAGFDLAVASSSRMEFLERKLKHTKLWDMFALHVYSAEYVAHGKPAPDIFLYAAEKLNHAPEHCLVIEDSVQGVKSGIAAGMHVWGFTGGGHCFEGHGDRLQEAGASCVVASFSHLIALLKKA